MGVKTVQINDVAAKLKGVWFVDPTADILTHIVDAASNFFEECPEHFALHHVTGDTVVFGDNVNRLLWSPLQGFRPDAEHCTPAFLLHYRGTMYQSAVSIQRTHGVI